MDKKTILLVVDEVFIALDEKEILENYNFNPLCEIKNIVHV